MEPERRKDWWPDWVGQPVVRIAASQDEITSCDETDGYDEYEDDEDPVASVLSFDDDHLFTHYRNEAAHMQHIRTLRVDTVESRPCAIQQTRPANDRPVQPAHQEVSDDAATVTPKSEPAEPGAS